MATLVSPGVQVNVIDQSSYIAGRPTSLPLIILATGDEKVQPDGITPALGTYEHGVIRTVTSLRQALELYGVPKYYKSATGQQHHGDSRNEHGLDALMKYLEVGNRAYVVRANVNLNDDIASIVALWDAKIADAAAHLEALVEDFLEESNAANGLYPTDSGYKTTVEAAELTVLMNEALDSVFASYSFSSGPFIMNFMEDHNVPTPGYQDVLFHTTGGFLQNSDVTGLVDGVTYTAKIRIVHDDTSGDGVDTLFSVAIDGEDASTYGALIAQLQDQLTDATSSISLIGGRLRIRSDYEGVTSMVEIVEDGELNVSAPLFASLNLYRRLDVPVPGYGNGALTVFGDLGLTQQIADFGGIADILENWLDGPIGFTDEFTAEDAAGILVDAADLYSHTKEFRMATSLGVNDSEKRASIVQQMQAVINNPYSGIRSEWLEYNMAVAPGFPECSDELLRLSVDMFEEVFVIGETPFNKAPTGPNGINAWAVTPARSTSPNIAYYYGHGISSNIDGADVLTTAASTALRTYAYSDSVSEVWYAPAGTQRGRCEHLTTVGYVTGTLGGPTTFVEEYLDNGMRDELYETPKNINPITFIPGRGILVLGQKTTHNITSALDRVNVSRLVKYIKRELRKGLFAYLFEPNDQITRDQVRFDVVNFLGDLISRRGLFDFAVIVDESNNTSERIDRNELWVDIAIKPVKAIDFIYVNITLVRTGANIGGNNILLGA